MRYRFRHRTHGTIVTHSDPDWADTHRQYEALDAPVEKSLNSMLKDELVALAEERGLDTSGTKADIIERLEG